MTQFIGPFDVKALKLAILTFLKGVLIPANSPNVANDVIFEFEDGPKPDKPYATVKLTGPIKVGTTDEIRMGSQTFPQRTFKCEVKFLSNDESAANMANAVQCAFEQPQFRQPLIDAGISIGNVLPVTDLSQWLDTFTERRCLLEFDVMVAALVDYDGGLINEVDIDGTVGTLDVTISAVRPS